MPELGGNDPLIILNDLDADDLEKAATIAVASPENSGQRCTAVSGSLFRSIADKITPLILEKAKVIRLEILRIPKPIGLRHFCRGGRPF